MNRTTLPTLELLTVLYGGPAIRGQAQTTLPPPAKDDPQSPGSVILHLGPEGVRVARTEDQAEQLRGKIPKGSVAVVCREVQMMQVLRNGKPALRIVCHRAVFCTNHGLEGRADVLQYDSGAAIRLIGAELIVDRHRNDPPDRMSAKEISVDLNDLRVRLSGVCTVGAQAKEPPQTGYEPRKKTTGRVRTTGASPGLKGGSR